MKELWVLQQHVPLGSSLQLAVTLSAKRAWAASM